MIKHMTVTLKGAFVTVREVRKVTDTKVIICRDNLPDSDELMLTDADGFRYKRSSFDSSPDMEFTQI